MTEKVHITLDDGSVVETTMHPVIVSASRATDIPAFYADWFFYRLQKGYSAWINPFNNKKGYVSYQDTRFIVFWSKNPKPLLEHLDELTYPTTNVAPLSRELTYPATNVAPLSRGLTYPATNVAPLSRGDEGIGCYIQYTLNDYEADGLEKKVPPIQERIDTFKRLVDRLGKERVIWRFDPLVLTEPGGRAAINTDVLLDKIERIGDQLKGYTEKLVFSFADIASYRKVKHNLKESNINYIEWDEPNMVDFAKRLVELNKKWGFTLATCGEKIDLPGVAHNSCIDHDLIIRLAHRDKALMDYLGVTIVPVQRDMFGNEEVAYPGLKATPLKGATYPGLTATPLKRGQEGFILLDDGTVAIQKKKMPDKGQRAACGCMVSKDIGQYNTCPHQCEYCYANASKELATENWHRHRLDPHSELIVPVL